MNTHTPTPLNNEGYICKNLGKPNQKCFGAYTKREKNKMRHKNRNLVSIESEHTPTPWIYSKDGEMIYTSGNAPFGYKLIKPSGKRPESEIKANAAFIVKAVNNHESLVEACQIALQRLKDLGRYKSDAVTCGMLEEALKQAEGE